MSKPKLLVLPFPLLSHYLRCAELLRGLEADFDIIFAGGTAVSKSVEVFNFQTVPAEDFDAAAVLECTRRFSFEWLNERELERVLSSQLAVIERVQPSLLVSDAAQTACMAADRSGLPHVSLVNGYMTRYYREVRQLPEAHPAAPLKNRVAPDLFDRIIRVCESGAMWKVHRAFRRVRRKLGLRFPGHYLQEYEGTVTAIVDDAQIFPQENVPSRFSFVGPAYYSGGESTQPSFHKPPTSRPVIVVALGSSGKWSGLAQLAGPLFQEFHVRAVGTIGDALRGENIEQHPFMEPRDLYRDAVVTICHGGNGTIYQSLAHGVPVLCRPSMFEQEWNVRGFEDAGLVRRIPRNAGPEELRALVREATTSPNDDEWRARTAKIDVHSTRTSFHRLLRSVVAV